MTRKGDVLALQFTMHRSPIRLGDPPVATFAASASIERCLQRPILHAYDPGAEKRVSRSIDEDLLGPAT